MPGMVRMGDTWVGQCALGHPGVDVGTYIPASGIVIGTAATCLANNLPKAKVGVDIIVTGCGHTALIITGATMSFSESAGQAIVGSIAAASLITGVIVNGSTDCIAN